MTPPADAARDRSPFEYAIVRVVPRVERGESFNAGHRADVAGPPVSGRPGPLDEAVLVALAPDCDPGVVRDHLAPVVAVADGDPGAGPSRALSMAERFHWLVSPSSTIIQPSEVHTGLTDDPAATLDHLFRTLVLR